MANNSPSDHPFAFERIDWPDVRAMVEAPAYFACAGLYAAEEAQRRRLIAARLTGVSAV